MKKALAAALIAAALVPAAALPSTAKGSSGKCKPIVVLDVDGNPYTVCQVRA